LAKVAFREKWVFSSLYMTENGNSSNTQGGFWRLLLKPKQAFGKRIRFFGSCRQNVVFPFGLMTLSLALFFSIFSLRANTASRKVALKWIYWKQIWLKFSKQVISTDNLSLPLLLLLVSCIEPRDLINFSKQVMTNIGLWE